MQMQQVWCGSLHSCRQVTIAIARRETISGEPIRNQPSGLLGGAQLADGDGDAAIGGVSDVGEVERTGWQLV
jgi:hypothetical protein